MLKTEYFYIYLKGSNVIFTEKLFNSIPEIIDYLKNQSEVYTDDVFVVLSTKNSKITYLAPKFVDGRLCDILIVVPINDLQKITIHEVDYVVLDKQDRSGTMVA